MSRAWCGVVLIVAAAMTWLTLPNGAADAPVRVEFSTDGQQWDTAVPDLFGEDGDVLVEGVGGADVPAGHAGLPGRAGRQLALLKDQS